MLLMPGEWYRRNRGLPMLPGPDPGKHQLRGSDSFMGRVRFHSKQHHVVSNGCFKYISGLLGECFQGHILKVVISYATFLVLT